jgi:hypothetical protein
MSERSHPRFAGIQMTIFKIHDEESLGEHQQAVLHLNDVPVEITAAYMAVATPAMIDEGLEDWEREDPEARRPKKWADDLGGVLDTLAAEIDETYRSGSR